MFMRTIIIGDIHGCNGALETILEQIEPESGKDRLVFLGDLFDRGPDSFGVLQTVKRLDAIFKEEFILLLGNHEDYLLQPHLPKWQRQIWEHVGRQATVTSFKRAGSKMEEAIPWLKEHVRLCWRTDFFQCVHAGLMLEPLEVNDLNTLIHNHETVLKNQYSGLLTITGHIALEKATWFTGDGETIKELEEEENYLLPHNGVICIDTGCGKGGKLTAMVTDGKRFSLYSAPER